MKQKHVNPYVDTTTYMHPDTFVIETVTIREDCLKTMHNRNHEKFRCCYIISGLEHDYLKYKKDSLCPQYKLDHLKDELRIWYEYRNRVYSAKKGEYVGYPEGTIHNRW